MALTESSTGAEGAVENTDAERVTRVALRDHLTDEVSVQDALHVETGDAPVPNEDEVLCRVGYAQIATAFTDLMRKDAEIPMPPYELGGTVGGAVVATVLESNSSRFQPGQTVFSFTGWQTPFVAAADSLVPLDTSLVPSPAYFLNHGVTAFHGMVDVAEVGPGDTVFISGAAGGVGSLAGQIAKARDADFVVGTAGSDEKVSYLVDELGLDAAINYKTSDVEAELRRLAPEGISVFFDNVGGAQLEAAVEVAASEARFALCGALSSQMRKGDKSLWPRLNLMTAITKNLTIRPFATYHTPDQIEAWNKHFGLWMSTGKMVLPLTELEGGIDDAPDALAALVAGKYRGGVVLKVAD